MKYDPKTIEFDSCKLLNRSTEALMMEKISPQGSSEYLPMKLGVEYF